MTTPGLSDPLLLPAYSPNLAHTYAFGRFAVQEALRFRPRDVSAVLWHSSVQEPHLKQLMAQAAGASVPCRQHDATVERLRRKATVDCLAVVSKRDEALMTNANHVVLVHPSHPGNVGTVIRSLVAFGFNDLGLIAPSIDPWGAYVVRASVGLRFALRCQVFPTLTDYVSAFPRRSFYAFDAGGHIELDEVRFRPPFSLFFGPEWHDRAEGAFLGATIPSVTIRIPQSEHVESLNLAASVSIAAFRARDLPGKEQ